MAFGNEPRESVRADTPPGSPSAFPTVSNTPQEASFLDWLIPWSPKNPVFGQGGLFDPNREREQRQGVGQQSFINTIKTQLAEGQISPEQAVAATHGMISLEEAQSTSAMVTRTERLDEISGQKRDKQLQNVEGARKPLEVAGDQIRRGYERLWNQTQADIGSYLEKWNSSVGDLENLSGQAAQDDLAALAGNVKNAKSQLKSQAEASEIPPDQVEVQSMMLDWQFAEAKGKVVRDYQIAYNNKRADMNTAFGQTYGSVLTSMRGIMGSAFGTTIQTLEQNAEQLAAVDVMRAEIEGAYYDGLTATRYSNDMIILGGATGSA